jgi:hypothetical protein
MDELSPGAIVSVSWRLQRITVEYALVSLPVADELVRRRLNSKGDPRNAR